LQTALLTYRDCVDHALDYVGGAVDATTERFARRAVQLAVSDYWSKKTWATGYRRGRIITTPPVGTGTSNGQLTYVASTQIVTLVGGTFPAWANDGNILLPNVPTGVAVIPYPIASVLTSTTAKLQTALAPLADITTPINYTLVQESYPLPVDFGAAGELVNMGFAREMMYVTPEVFIGQQRVNVSPANPFIYTIQWDSRRYGSLVASFYPAPDALYTLDYSYQRQGRALNTHGIVPVIAYTDGNVSVGSSSTTVTGTATNWTPDMVGCIIRFASSTNSKTPTGPMGTSPFYLQRTIVGYTSPTSITIDQVTGVALTNVPHAISDPVDLEAGAMTTYFLREVESQMRLSRRISPEPFELQAYHDALIGAMEADNRHHEARSTFQAQFSAIRISTLPRGPDLGG
jgi:hypothetical protein